MNRKMHGQSETRLYNLWCGIKTRCYNRNDANYANYGGKGVEMCPEWKNDYMAFYDWAMANGYKPEAPRGECTIDRIDPSGPYSPENCRWATMREQENNKRNNRRITIGDETKTLKQWCSCNSENYGTVLKRIARREKGEIPRTEYLEKSKERKQAIRQAIKENPGMSIRMLANKTGFSKSAIQREKSCMETVG